MELHERVEADSKLSSAEKETTISMYGDNKEATIHSFRPSVVRSLLQHDHLEVTEIIGRNNNGSTVRTDDRTTAQERLQVIHGVTGKIPVGCLKVKSTRRSNDYQANIVSNETTSRNVREDAICEQ